jgi:nicotinamidase-related amidase
MELDPRTTAVITIHCQGDIVGPGGAFAQMFHEQVLARDVVGRIQDLHRAARQVGSLVVYTRIACAEDYADLKANSPLLQGVVQAGCLQEGGAQTEIIDPVAPQEGDVVITNQRVGGWTPELIAVLEERGIDTLLICGVATNISVENTARAAGDAGYRVLLVEDACSAATAEAHRSTVESLGLLAEITTVVEARQALGSSDRMAGTGL